MVAGVDEHDLDRRLDRDGQVNQHRVGHRRGQAEMGVEGMHRPPDDGTGRLVLEPLVQFGQVGVGQIVNVQQAHDPAHSPAPTSAT